jgi:hypothetical protein
MESRDAEKRHRQERFARTERHVRRQLTTMATKGLRVDPDPEPTLARWRNTPGWFKKNRWQRHSCGKRRHGRPSIGYGICHIGLREAVRQRRKLRQELLNSLSVWQDEI